MTGDTVECFNCGRANPAWAQVCRSCGVPLRTAAADRAQSAGPIPTDRDSLISIGAGVGSIVLAILIGIILSGLIPEAPPVAEETPTPIPGTPIASASGLPSGGASGIPASAEPTPALVGSVAFGFGLDANTRQVVEPTDTFGPGTNFCHAITMTQPFGVSQVQEEILKVAEDGSLTVVQERAGSNLTVQADAQVAGFCVGADNLISGWGAGNYVLRDYRNPDAPELIAEGRFTLTN